MTEDAPAAPGQVRLLLSTTEQALEAGDLIAAQVLTALEPHLSSTDARGQLDELGFDWAPVAEVPIARFVTRRELGEAASGSTVDSVAAPITPSLLIAETAVLGAVLERLRDSPVLFVHHRGHVTGILTRADLEQPAVSLLVLGLVITAEAGIDELVSRADADWLQQLSPNRRERVLEVFESRRRRNVDLAIVNCLNLDDRLRIARKLGLHEQLGFSSKNELRNWKERIGYVRDCLAHGDTLLGAVPDPLEALVFVRELRNFAMAACASPEPRSDSDADP